MRAEANDCYGAPLRRKLKRKVSIAPSPNAIQASDPRHHWRATKTARLPELFPASLEEISAVRVTQLEREAQQSHPIYRGS